MMDDIQTYLSVLQNKISLANSMGKTDLNLECEDFFCKLLNLIYGLNLTNLNRLQVNFPAIDLGDTSTRICFQVTSEDDIGKIRETLDSFRAKELHKEYDKINILILGSKKKHRAKLDYKEFVFSYDENLFDITKLLNEIAKKDTLKLEEIFKLFKTEYSDKIFEIIKETREDKDLYYPKTILEDNYIAYYAYGLGQVRIDALLPINFEQELTCYIIFQQIGLSDCRISLDENEIIEWLFKGRDKGVSTERKLVWHIDSEKENIGINLPNNRFTCSKKTALQLCEIINDLHKSYLIAKSKIYEVLGATNFSEVKTGEFLIIQIPKWIWLYMVDFAQAHDYYIGKTSWDIFKPLHLVQKNRIIIYKNHLDKTNADVLAELYVEDISNYYVDVVWKSGYTPFVDKMDGFNNKIKWKVNYSHDWLLNDFIPYISYLNYTDSRTLFDKIFKRAFTFEEFKKTFDYKKHGIESTFRK